MDYKITREELHNDLLLDTLRALYNVLNGLNLPLYIVGATARDMMMSLLQESEAKRKTRDLDIAISIKDWSRYEEVKSALLANKFNKLSPKQKFVYKGEDGKNDYEVDVVPFGPIAEDEIIKWPPEMCPEMSVKCFEDVMFYAFDVEIDGGIFVKIAPLWGQFLIKFDAWLDRNEREFKDAEDMAYILHRYYNVMLFYLDTEDFDGINLELDKDELQRVGAQLIAKKMKSSLSDKHKKYYIEKISQQLDAGEDSRLLQQFSKFVVATDSSAFDLSKDIWSIINNILIS